MPIYTKKGDKGETGLPGRRRLSKTDNIFECLGGLDQTNALIGLAVSLIDHQQEKKLVAFLEQLQSDLLSVGSIIAAESSASSHVLPNFNKRALELEHQIDQWDSELPELKNFILPGGCQTAAVIHLARVSVRQAERAFHRLKKTTGLEPIAVLLNRLSDYFFQCARYLNMRANKPDIIWSINDSIS